MSDQTIQVNISPIGIGGGGGSISSISAEDYLTYDNTEDTVGVEDGTAVDQVAYWDGGQWVIAQLEDNQLLYTNSNRPNLNTVRDGIDQILFEDAGFNYVRLEGNNVTVLELGDEINTSIQLSWDIDKAQSELDILSASSAGIDGDFTVIDKSSASPVDISLDTAVTATSISRDEAQMTLEETRPDGSTNQVTAKAVVDHRARIWYGVDELDTPTETMVKNGLANTDLRNNYPNGPVSIDASVSPGSNYLYFAWPKSMGDASRFLVGGFETTFKRYTVSVTNAFGVTKDYYVYRSANKTSGSDVSVEIE